MRLLDQLGAVKGLIPSISSSVPSKTCCPQVRLHRESRTDLVFDHMRMCRAVANLAVALLSLEESEGRLLELLARARNPLGKPLFDPKYALRLAKERNR